MGLISDFLSFYNIKLLSVRTFISVFKLTKNDQIFLPAVLFEVGHYVAYRIKVAIAEVAEWL